MAAAGSRCGHLLLCEAINTRTLARRDFAWRGVEPVRRRHGASRSAFSTRHCPPYQLSPTGAGRMVRDGDRCAIDIDANLGVYSLSMALLVGPSGRVFFTSPEGEARAPVDQSRARNDLDDLEIIVRPSRIAREKAIVRLPRSTCRIGRAGSTLPAPMRRLSAGVVGGRLHQDSRRRRREGSSQGVADFFLVTSPFGDG
jgi:hypothetical protein